MTFIDFPFDKQLCPIRLESFAYSNQELMFDWDNDASIDYNGQLHMADFILTRKFIRKNCTAQYKTGDFRNSIRFSSLFSENCDLPIDYKLSPWIFHG